FREPSTAGSDGYDSVASRSARRKCVFPVQRAPGGPLRFPFDRESRSIHLVDEQTGRPKSGGTRPIALDRVVFPFASVDLEARGSGESLVEGRRASLAPQNLLNSFQVFFGVDPDGVIRSLAHIDGNSVLQEAQLFQALGAFERRFGPCDE